ncbi:MAG: hypothetical protein AAB385_07515, partial [Planctomycetota bacterium]
SAGKRQSDPVAPHANRSLLSTNAERREAHATDRTSSTLQNLRAHAAPHSTETKVTTTLHTACGNGSSMSPIL